MRRDLEILWYFFCSTSLMLVGVLLYNHVIQSALTEGWSAFLLDENIALVIGATMSTIIGLWRTVEIHPQAKKAWKRIRFFLEFF